MQRQNRSELIVFSLISNNKTSQAKKDTQRIKIHVTEYEGILLM
jgi:hypothetical protein